MGLLRQLAVAAVVLMPMACGTTTTTSPHTIAALRGEGHTSDDSETVGRWALAEELAPGGNAQELARALGRLDALKKPSMLGSTARALVAESHGHPRAAADAYLAALDAARSSRAPEVNLVAWYVAHRLSSLRLDVSNLFDAHRALFEDVVKNPGGIGWRATAELADWMGNETYRRAEISGKDFDRYVVQTSGCLTDLRLAGPFGHGHRARSPKALRRRAPRPLARTSPRTRFAPSFRSC